MVPGIIAFKVSKAAGWMMIAAPIITSVITVISLLGMNPVHSISNGSNYAFLLNAVLPSFGQLLFYAGVFMVVLQAKALKKRAEEQQMLLDDITSRQ